MNNICEKHRAAPAKIYSQCIGCEIDNLNKRIKEQEELLRWFRGHQGWTGWVSVEERLPEEDGLYLTYSPAGINTVRFKTFNNIRAFCDLLGCNVYPAITHWMPLPEPPVKEDTQ